MSAVYWSRDKQKNARLLACRTVETFWTYSRVNCDVHWNWDDSEECYQTHRWTNDARRRDVRSWPAETALSSFLAAIRGDDRLAGDPMIRLLAFYITVEYLAFALERVRIHE